jgi:hypothetical protein
MFAMLLALYFKISGVRRYTVDEYLVSSMTVI